MVRVISNGLYTMAAYWEWRRFSLNDDIRQKINLHVFQHPPETVDSPDTSCTVVKRATTRMLRRDTRAYLLYSKHKKVKQRSVECLGEKYVPVITTIHTAHAEMSASPSVQFSSFL
jgi:hypothetical protein